MTVELNGRFVAVVQRAGGFRRAGEREARLRLPRAWLAPRNELVVHVESEAPGCSGAASGAATRLLPDSTLDLRDAAEIVSTPDVVVAVREGWPFTRRADLGETGIVLPHRASPGAIRAMLGAVAQLARTGGALPEGVDVRTADDVTATWDRDLLVVGATEEHPWLRLAGAWSPARVDGDGVAIRAPKLAARLAAWASLRDLGHEIDRAALDARRASSLGVGLVTAVSSPLAPGRSVVMLSATRDDAMPDLARAARVTGGPSGDVMVLADGPPIVVRVGVPTAAGSVGTARRVLWFLSEHVALLVPLLLGGCALVAWQVLAMADRRAKSRLA
jgi:cellulose synthase (UDP-forming)